ncbi:MAG TPA: AAA family ATPase [Acidimicrobiales bacterium]|nr:AAA family ATPase [Acidimicrobiales bacterium]
MYRVLRKAGKRFEQERADGAGGWIGGRGCMQGVPRVLYRLPSVVEAVTAGRTVFVVEGEKDVHALERAGETATCNPQGAANWAKVDATPLHGASEVVVVRDRDADGIKWAADVEASLTGKVGRILVVDPVPTHKGADAADHLGHGYTVDEFETISVWEHPAEPAAAAGFFVDWSSFWAKDRRDADWLVEDVLARGRGHSLFAGHKVGKSLFTLWVSLQLIRAEVVVIYLDYEMGEDDLYDRLSDMGHGPGSNLELLRYALLPSLPPLDQPDGATALLTLVDEVQAEHPGRHVAVVIDTTGRAVAGDENSADTIRAFYRWTGLHLKQRGVTWARLDHAGKDATKGQRGSSAKGDDVDIVWRLSRTEDGIELRREAARMGWVPERVAFHLSTEPLAYKRVAAGWPAGTKEVAELLDKVGVPLDAGERPAGKALREAGHKATQALIRAAIRWRRESATTPEQEADF